jgi:hypothetical protein
LCTFAVWNRCMNSFPQAVILSQQALGRDRVAEKLGGKILKATDLFPWTPAEIFYWTFAWLHLLAYGEEAKTRRRFQPWYGADRRKRGLIPAWDGCEWALAPRHQNDRGSA